MHRFTKIVATLGPASESQESLEKLIAAGMNVVRLNFSHGTAQEHIDRFKRIRQAGEKMKKAIGIMADLQGPKIRIGRFKDNQKVTLPTGSTFILDTECKLGDHQRVGLDYPELINDVKIDDILLLDDGKVIFKVLKIHATEIDCEVIAGGELSNNKGINRQGGGLTAPALTEKDLQDIQTIGKLDFDFVAISFPKTGADMQMARTFLKQAGSNAQIIAKIERVEATENIDDILVASDGVMVARGDLAVEAGDAFVPALQKKIIQKAREQNRFVITATQMMESMITSPVPTRAEVSDVANAVLDGTDAVMLSAETASGSHPVKAVEAMARVCHEAEKSVNTQLSMQFLDRKYYRIDQAIAMSALFGAHHLQITAIAALTNSGSTALWMSRLCGNVPVYAITPDRSTCMRCSILRGVTPLLSGKKDMKDLKELLADAEAALVRSESVSNGDLIAITYGEPIGLTGGTNTLKFIKIGSKI